MASSEGKKQIVTGTIAGVLLVAAAVLIYRNLTGAGDTPPPPLDAEVTGKLAEVAPTPDPVANPVPPGSGRLGNSN